ncbi:MAG: hypothetical protein KGL43_04020 [Burkholderiales bacterium]|nr:hypothetical protein [Burkholderiales bacterium]
MDTTTIYLILAVVALTVLLTLGAGKLYIKAHAALPALEKASALDAYHALVASVSALDQAVVDAQGAAAAGHAKLDQYRATVAGVAAAPAAPAAPVTMPAA